MTLINYVKGIGTLATNKPGLFRPNIDKLKTSLGTLNTSLPTIGVSSLDSSTIDSGFNLVNLLADIFTFNFRKKNSKDYGYLL
ncbi:hypothetical protein AM1_E0018 (plasmid) [Acaryochloris marina MBIC11017]|uniref:Uncharacterized protein n=1 Tax=Acaryochloris marina (strain MBIC 11017) TaxID=329726 RepID=A8ZP52_ACAM1|nr:hypothetical protein AM1_E0018 [Acaryochloris marina MBIC11017]